MSTTRSNLDAFRDPELTEHAIREAIENDGTLVVQVSATYVVDHAAGVVITRDTLAKLIEGLGPDAIHISRFRIIDASND